MKTLSKLLLLLVIAALSCNLSYAQSNSWSQDEAKSKIVQIEDNYKNTDNIVFDSNTTVEDYIQIAAYSNPKLKSAFYAWKRDLEKAGYAGSLPDPMIVYGYFIENVETRVGPQNQKLSLRQSIPWFGSLSDKENIAFEKSNVSYKKFQSELLSLSYQVKIVYYELYYLGKEIEITKANIELLTFWESIARVRYKVALQQHPDIIKAQIELGKLEDRLITLTDSSHPLNARLTSLLNISNTIEIPLPKSIEVIEEPASAEYYVNIIQQNNPDLLAIKHLIQKEQYAVQLANKSSRPNFTFGIDYIETGDAINSSMDESGKDPWVASVGISLPIWFGKNNSKKNEALASKKSVEYSLQDKENQLKVLAERIIFEHNDALRKAELYRDGLLPKAEQSLNATYASYQSGKTDFLNLLDAQRQLLDFQLILYISKTNLAKRKAELDMLTGFELKTKQ